MNRRDFLVALIASPAAAPSGIPGHGRLVITMPDQNIDLTPAIPHVLGPLEFETMPYAELVQKPR